MDPVKIITQALKYFIIKQKGCLPKVSLPNADQLCPWDISLLDQGIVYRLSNGDSQNTLKRSCNLFLM